MARVYGTVAKMSLLFGVKDVIIIMLNKLYSISDQITILSNTSSKFSITPDTYRLFLRYELPEEYRKFKINQIFLRKISAILRLKNSGYSFDKQFLELLPDGLEVDKKPVIVEDYHFFIENYVDIPLERKKVHIKSNKIEYKLQRNPDTRIMEAVAIAAPPPTVIDDILDEDVATDTAPEQTHEKEVQVAKNKSKKVDTENLNDIYDNLYEQEEGKLNILPDISVDNIPKRYEILTNRFTHPSEVNLFAETDNITFNEEFVYIFNRELIHAVNLNEFCRDNILVVVGTSYDEEYRSGYLLYRWYKGKLYFIEHYELFDFGASFERQTRMWMDEHYSSALANFIWDEWCEFKMSSKTKS